MRAFELAVARGDEELLGALVVARELVEAALHALVLGDLVLELLTQALVLLLRRICDAARILFCSDRRACSAF